MHASAGILRGPVEPVSARLAALLVHWTALKGTRALPRHSQLDPVGLWPWLGSLLLVEVHDGPRRFYYRLTGTIVDERYGDNFTGRWLEDLTIPGSEGYWLSAYQRMAEGRTPLGGRVIQYDDRRNAKPCEWLMLPLEGDLPPRGGPAYAGLLVATCVDFDPMYEEFRIWSPRPG